MDKVQKLRIQVGMQEMYFVLDFHLRPSLTLNTLIVCPIGLGQVSNSLKAIQDSSHIP
jgi:hypothetical protein